MSNADTLTVTRQKLRSPSSWKVVMYNDDFTPMDFVTIVLISVFHKSQEQAVKTMLTIHEAGRASVGVYTKDVAQTKADEVMALAKDHGYPLLCKAEEA